MYRSLALILLLPPLSVSASTAAKPKPKSKPQPHDTLTFENGDTLTGQFDREVSGTVYFKSNELGDLSIPWKKIKTLHTREGFVVLQSKPGVHLRHSLADAVEGTLAVEHGTLRVTPGTTPLGVIAGRAAHGQSTAAAPQPIPEKDAQYILDEKTFDRQLRGEPKLFQGWNGSATAGVTLVQGTENQYSYTSAVALTRTVPTVSWLATRNRTQVDFSSSYGEITQPAYSDNGVLIAATYTKTSIFHADAERDEYIANRVYPLVQTSFDHNFSQGLDLQQIYGAGFGVTAIKRSTQQLDLKATLQYEQQRLIAGSGGTIQDLVGSTLSGTYAVKLKRGVVFKQQIAYIPAFNIARDYSANETSTLTIPFYKNVALSLGTIDSYLNDPLPAEPPTTRNSFQFTTGVTYTLKSKY